MLMHGRRSLSCFLNIWHFLEEVNYIVINFLFFFVDRVDLLPYDLITQLFRILSVAYDSRGKNSNVVHCLDKYCVE